jgi:hypothetical protein
MTQTRVRWYLVLIAVVAAVGVLSSVLITGRSGRTGPVLTVRDRNWQQDIAYLASELPQVRIGGLGAVSAPAWRAAAARLEAEVPGLTDGQIVVGMARMVALLHDDETMVELPQEPFYPLDSAGAADSMYLTGVPVADRSFLGAQLLAIDGHPVAAVMNDIGSTLDYQDQGLHDDEEGDLLTTGPILYWLGITRSATSAIFTVRTASGMQRNLQLAAVANYPDMAYVPVSLYQQDSGAPYWMKLLPGQDAVYLKYNDCLSTTGFQQLAAQAVAILAREPGYRLIVDLRDNGGGDSAPFQSLIEDITASSAINRRGRIFGLVNTGTDSSATADAQNLKSETNAILIGTPPADPLDGYGDEATFQLPHSDVVIQYTTALINTSGQDWGMPQVTVAPTPAQVMAGEDPVLAEALSYGRPPH